MITGIVIAIFMLYESQSSYVALWSNGGVGVTRDSLNKKNKEKTKTSPVVFFLKPAFLKATFIILTGFS